MIEFAIWYLTIGVGFAMFHSMTGQTKSALDTQTTANESTVRKLLENSDIRFARFYRNLVKFMIYLQIMVLIILFYPIFILASICE